MSHTGFGVVPAFAIKRPEVFNFQISNLQIEILTTLLRLCPIAPETWYNRQEDLEFGLSRRWMIEARDEWLEFNFHQFENDINLFPNFRIPIEDPDHGTVSIHFVGLFSKKHDAVPIIFMHGWPGSFLEFRPMLRLLTQRFTPETLPYHIIVPSIPGYGLSSSGNLENELTLDQAPRLMHQLMMELGFGTGYVAQGGDVGSNLAGQMSARFEECKAYHLNFLGPEPGDDLSTVQSPTSEEREQMERGKNFAFSGSAYVFEHGFRPATIGHCIASSPIALLAWIGEKYVHWTDPLHRLSIQTILELTTLYWLTETFPRSLYPYRHLAPVLASGDSLSISKSTIKPFGYAAYPFECVLMPKAWAHQVYPNLIQYSRQDKGGHFAALEQPEIFLDDVLRFVELVRSRGIFV
ncbi:putative epoxide hydrolase [Colletotrichum fructicola]|uniref:Epoxide hydrolase, putative n=2 Tax=Colletotrichum fructicola (strain Nara gc5) TaxID=1213859 RepID=L2GHY7_COLFN|nr:putative epoxide hydrolase [Colletotrichum fructicola]KAF4914764.1 putative epoxide hydrolase [Colletotrichum fructicola]KAF4941308.1 putative epoxide hydrolase [Colletotrichum fructicola]